MPRSEIERNRTLSAIGSLSDKPRLIEEGTWLNPNGRAIKVRVGDIDRSSWSKNICDWMAGEQIVPFIRATHIEFVNGKAVLSHPAFDTENSKDSNWGQAAWNGPSEMAGPARIVCQAIVNPHVERRLVWAVVPSGCVLGNSVSFLDLPEQVTRRLEEEFGTLEGGLSFLATRLNSDDLDLWSKAWAANNNVNNYEIEMLPFDSLEDDSVFSVSGNDSSV